MAKNNLDNEVSKCKKCGGAKAVNALNPPPGMYACLFVPCPVCCDSEEIISKELIEKIRDGKREWQRMV